MGKSDAAQASQRDRVEQCGICARGIEADFCVAHARDLVAGGFDDVGAGLDVSAMYGYDFFGRIFENVRGPERAVDIGAEEFELGGHAAVEDVGVREG